MRTRSCGSGQKTCPRVDPRPRLRDSTSRPGLAGVASMSPGLRALLAGVVDYAGLFPPARLPLDQAIRRYAEYRQGTDAWMLGRFVCPAARPAGRRAGFKLRCGGLDAAAFPSASQVAAVLKIAREARVPLKFTAGLHHPLPRPDPATGATMHGFVNVFVAAALEWAHGLDLGTLSEILADADPESFSFLDGVRWGDLSVAPPLVEEARRDLAVSFGSCSFDE